MFEELTSVVPKFRVFWAFELNREIGDELELT